MAPKPYGSQQPHECSSLGKQWLKSCLVEKDLGALVDSQINMSQQYTQVDKRANSIVAWIRNAVAAGLEK